MPILDYDRRMTIGHSSHEDTPPPPPSRAVVGGQPWRGAEDMMRRVAVSSEERGWASGGPEERWGAAAGVAAGSAVDEGDEEINVDQVDDINIKEENEGTEVYATFLNPMDFNNLEFYFVHINIDSDINVT